MSRASWLIVPLAAVAVLAAAPPAHAQLDVSGEWASTFHEDLPHRGGMRLGDYTGLPLNEAGWRKAQSWDEAARSLPERQCIPHVVTYALRGPATIRFSKVVDVESGRLIAYSLVGSYGRPRTIWMDGREHPSDLAPHTWGGFSTGTWERNTLVVTTTHIKTGWLQRNGAPTSDLATMKEHFIRHGDHLLVVSFVNDPVFLSEPLVRTTNYVASPTANANAWGQCGPAQIGDELPGRAKGEVPHYLPGDLRTSRTSSRAPAFPPRALAAAAPRSIPSTAARCRSAWRPPIASSRRRRPPAPSRSAARPKPTGEVRVIPVQGNVHMLAGAGGNIAVQVGEEGVLLVDSGAGNMTDKVLAAIRQLAPTSRSATSSTRTRTPTRWAATTPSREAASGPAGAVAVKRAMARVGDRARGGADGDERADRPGHRRRPSAPGRPTPTPGTPRKCSSTAKRSSSCISRPRTPRATAWCSSAAPTSWSPATSSTSRAIR